MSKNKDQKLRKVMKWIKNKPIKSNPSQGIILLTVRHIVSP